MIESQPLVSIIIPTYKRPDNLMRAIQSVRDQTYPNIEIIVVDDNGEGTKWQMETRKNGSAARNTGFRASYGEYINFLDDDDILKPDMIGKQVNLLQKADNTIGATYATPIYIFKTRKGTNKEYPSYGTKDGDLTCDYLLGKIHFNTTGLLFKRSALEKLQGFDEKYRRHQDYELMIRFARYFKMIHSYSEPLYYMDQSSEGSHGVDGQERIKFEEDFAQDFKKDLEREGCFKQYMHFTYWQCIIQFLSQKDYKATRYCIKKSLSYGIFSFVEFKEITKNIIKNILGL